MWSTITCLPWAAFAAPSPEREQRDLEGAIPHRRLDLSGVRRWQREAQRWAAGGLPVSRVTVVHLWAVECEPCLREFPLLRQMAQAWRRSGDVRFVFLSETLDEAKLLAFWRINQSELPDEDPYQSTDSKLRDELETGLQPMTLLIDQNHVIRQAFVGSLEGRATLVSAAIERLLHVLEAPERASPKRR